MLDIFLWKKFGKKKRPKMWQQAEEVLSQIPEKKQFIES